MVDVLGLIVMILPYCIGGLVVFIVMRLKHNDEIRRLTLEAYYKGKKDGENAALREQLEKANGNKD